MRRSQADSTNRSLAAFGKLQHIRRNRCTAALEQWAFAPAHHSEHIANIQAVGEMPPGEGTWPVS